ncbi:uncharacterized protein V6R79_012392 [Siganus canaliculatus]
MKAATVQHGARTPAAAAPTLRLPGPIHCSSPGGEGEREESPRAPGTSQQAEEKQEKEELGRQLVAGNKQTELLKGQNEELPQTSESSQEKLTSDLQEQRMRHNNIQATPEKVSIFISPCCVRKKQPKLSNRQRTMKAEAEKTDSSKTSTRS